MAGAGSRTVSLRLSRRRRWARGCRTGLSALCRRPSRSVCITRCFQVKVRNRGIGTLYEALHLERGTSLFPAPGTVPRCRENTALKEAVLYFPGCGGSLLSRTIGLSALGLLLRTASLLSCPKRICAAATRCCLRGPTHSSPPTWRGTKRLCRRPCLRDQARLPGDAHCHGMWFVP